jgi:hypothetical protein
MNMNNRLLLAAWLVSTLLHAAESPQMAPLAPLPAKLRLMGRKCPETFLSRRPTQLPEQALGRQPHDYPAWRGCKTFSRGNIATP